MSNTEGGRCWKLMTINGFSITLLEGPRGCTQEAVERTGCGALGLDKQAKSHDRTRTKEKAPERQPTTGRSFALPLCSMDLLPLGVRTPARPSPLALHRLVAPVAAAAWNVGVTKAARCEPLHFTFCGA